MAFMNNVLNELEKNNKTQKELCNSIGVSINTFRGWASKNVQPPVDIAYKISQELNISLEQLVSGKPEHPAEKKLNEVKKQLTKILDTI